jgi:hypothetical protein
MQREHWFADVGPNLVSETQMRDLRVVNNVCVSKSWVLVERGDDYEGRQDSSANDADGGRRRLLGLPLLPPMLQVQAHARVATKSSPADATCQLHVRPD